MTPTVALAFDDGPGQWTHPILDVLRKHQARATFFVLGCNIANHESALIRMVDAGHEIAIHGWDHTPVSELTRVEFRESIERTAAAIRAFGPEPLLWHPPWNRGTLASLEVIEALGYQHVTATVDAGDVSRKERWILDQVLPQITDGAIIGLHDGIAANGQQVQRTRLPTVRAVRKLLLYCRSVTVSELRP